MAVVAWRHVMGMDESSGVHAMGRRVRMDHLSRVQWPAVYLATSAGRMRFRSRSSR
jgi:hypothetical protein